MKILCQLPMICCKYKLKKLLNTYKFLNFTQTLGYTNFLMKVFANYRRQVVSINFKILNKKCKSLTQILEHIVISQ